jgi:hypothetical protein
VLFGQIVKKSSNLFHCIDRSLSGVLMAAAELYSSVLSVKDKSKVCPPVKMNFHWRSSAINALC